MVAFHSSYVLVSEVSLSLFLDNFGGADRAIERRRSGATCPASLDMEKIRASDELLDYFF